MKETSLLKLKIFSLADLFVAGVTDNIELRLANKSKIFLKKKNEVSL
jgi:hypothetical protein